MDEFENYLFSVFNKAVTNIHHSPYAIGLHIFYEGDDLRKPGVRLITNTYEHAKVHSPENGKRRRGDADSELEALWNSSFWIWKTEATVGNEYLSFEGDYVDIEGISLREKWVRSLGLWYEDSFEEANFDEALEIGGKIDETFKEVCLRLARKLHSVIAEGINTDLPIIFFDREGPSPESLELTFIANPPHLLKGFAHFVRTYMGDEWGDFMEKNVDKNGLTYASLYE